MATISPADAEVALRTFPRRWNALLAGDDGSDEDGTDETDADRDRAARHPGPDGRSALDCAAAAATTLEATDGHVRSTVTRDHPSLDPPAVNRAGDDALRRIEAAAPALADTVAAVAAGDLDRRAELAGAPVTVRELISEAVEEVATLLRDATGALRAGRAARR